MIRGHAAATFETGMGANHHGAPSRGDYHTYIIILTHSGSSVGAEPRSSRKRWLLMTFRGVGVQRIGNRCGEVSCRIVRTCEELRTCECKHAPKLARDGGKRRDLARAPYSPTHLEPLNMYLVVFCNVREYFRENPLPRNVRQRIKQPTKHYIDVMSDWISYPAHLELYQRQETDRSRTSSWPRRSSQWRSALWSRPGRCISSPMRTRRCPGVCSSSRLALLEEINLVQTETGVCTRSYNHSGSVDGGKEGYRRNHSSRSRSETNASACTWVTISYSQAIPPTTTSRMCPSLRFALSVSIALESGSMFPIGGGSHERVVFRFLRQSLTAYSR
ncbi:hypothetical protein BJY52DRAFT_1422309 [Lactarius psammicola]|nr:hypothetical protein BJY52DRAFT_1422309 [Lactarius psammicola]